MNTIPTVYLGQAHVFDFDEAVQLMATGCHGFVFRNDRGGFFRVELDDHEKRTVVWPVNVEKRPNSRKVQTNA
jgi:hypothetical protein